jgi:hypothetical protein
MPGVSSHPQSHSSSRETTGKGYPRAANVLEIHRIFGSEGRLAHGIEPTIEFSRRPSHWHVIVA